MLVLFVVLGSLPNRDASLWLVGITVWAIVVGWLIGPLATGPFPAVLRAVAAYALVGSSAYLLVGTVESVLIASAPGDSSDLATLAVRVASQLLYGLLYLPVWAGFTIPLALVWALAVRALRRRAGLAPAKPSSSIHPGDNGPSEAARRGRIALISAAIIVAYGLFVAILPLILYSDPRPPWWIDRPIALFSLFAVPAVVAAVGVWRDVRSLLVAAGIMCLLQAYIAFSGVTLGFAIPAIALLWAAGAAAGAAAGSPDARPPRRTAWIAGFGVIALTVLAWVSVLGLTEPRCWTGQQAADGSISMIEIPASDAELHGPIAVSSGGGGCSSAELTMQGMSIGAILAIGAVVVAAASTLGGTKSGRIEGQSS